MLADDRIEGFNKRSWIYARAGLAGICIPVEEGFVLLTHSFRPQLAHSIICQSTRNWQNCAPHIGIGYMENPTAFILCA